MVKWKGYTNEHNTWKPEKNLEHAPEWVQAFHSRHSAAPCQIAATIFQELIWKPKHVFTTPTISHTTKIDELEESPNVPNTANDQKDKHNNQVGLHNRRQFVPVGKTGNDVDLGNSGEHEESVASDGVNKS